MFDLNVKLDEQFLFLLGFSIEVFEEFCRRDYAQLEFTTKEYLPDFIVSALMVHAMHIDSGDFAGWAGSHLEAVLTDLLGEKPSA